MRLRTGGREKEGEPSKASMMAAQLALVTLAEDELRLRLDYTV
jgi:hypothetical protein